MVGSVSQHEKSTLNCTKMKGTWNFLAVSRGPEFSKNAHQMYTGKNEISKNDTNQPASMNNSTCEDLQLMMAYFRVCTVGI